MRPQRHEPESRLGFDRVEGEARAVDELDDDVGTLDLRLLGEARDLAVEAFDEVVQRPLRHAGDPELAHS